MAGQTAVTALDSSLRASAAGREARRATTLGRHAPGLRFVALATVAEGGGSTGNLDHPQYVWLRRQLTGARRRDELVVAYGHHSLETDDQPA
jgi:hypothetical protein